MRFSISTVPVFLLLSQQGLCQDNPAASVLSEAIASATQQNPAASILSEAAAAASQSNAAAGSAFLSAFEAITSLAPSSTTFQTVVASPTPVPFTPPTQFCTFKFTALNRIQWASGGGRYVPYQPGDNSYIFDFEIFRGDEKKKSSYRKKLDTPRGYDEFAFSVGKGDYGGNHNMWATAVYDWRNASWMRCGVSFDGEERIKGEEDNDVDTWYGVSDQTSECSVKYAC